MIVIHCNDENAPSANILLMKKEKRRGIKCLKPTQTVVMYFPQNILHAG